MTYSTADIIEFISEKKQHLYRRRSDQMPIPGVTSILQVLAKPALIQWAANMASGYWRDKALALGGSFSDADRETTWDKAKNAHRTFSKDAANIGTEVHKYAEHKLKGLPTPALTTAEAARGAAAFDQWAGEHKVELGTSERVCFSQVHWYAGTCDFVGHINGQNCVADFKTSSGIYPEMRLQLAAYRAAIEEETGQKFKACWIIRFDKKTGAFETARYTEHERDFDGFLAALRLHRTLQAIEAQDG